MPPRHAHLITALASAWLLAASNVAAAEEAPKAFEFYGKLYPEWKVQRYGTPSPAGTEVGTMGTLRNDRSRLVRDGAPREEFNDHEWSNSYLGVRGEWLASGFRFGYDLQVVVDLQGDRALGRNLQDNAETRDAYLYVDNPALGRLAVGKMDSIYKEWGDRGRMFGITSGNFIGTSRLISGVGWRGSGDTSFHVRRSHMLAWFSPSWSGWELGLTHSYDENGAGPGGRDSKLTALALRWKQGPWYAALATEIHRDWLPVSRGASPTAGSIVNDGSTTSSTDRAWRLSFAWDQRPLKLTADVAWLRYGESDRIDLPGRFRWYRTTRWQVTAEYRLTREWRLAFNHVRAAAGSCGLSGGQSCSTTGLAGHQTGLGAYYEIDRSLGFFLVAARTSNDASARFGSAPQGASIDSYAFGVKYQF